MAENDPYSRHSYPKLFVISGPSGVGKDTIADLLMTTRDDFYFVVTATTRVPRPGEIDGQDYFFVSHDEFTQMIERGELLEYAEVYDDFKGVPKRQIREALESNQDVIMRVDVQGAATLRKLIPQAVFIFLMAESEEALNRRLRGRKSDSAEALNLRIATARQELKRMPEFDYTVVNADDRQEEAVCQILSIIDAEHCRVEQRPVSL